MIFFIELTGGHAQAILPALSFALAIYALVGHADALAHKDIYAAKKLTVVKAGECARIAFKFGRYDFDDRTVTVYWNDTRDHKLLTEFSDMVQFKNDAGSRREFHRC